MIVLSEATIDAPRTASERDNYDMTQAARLAGCRVYYIPSNFDKCGNAENALWHIPAQESETTALWIGFIPTPERYAAICQAARAKNLRLVNNPEQHLLVQNLTAPTRYYRA